jgi:hypothetical protein
MNYGIVYTAWGLVGFMLLQIAGFIKDTTDFQLRLSPGRAMLVLPLLMNAGLKSPQPEHEPAKRSRQK